MSLPREPFDWAGDDDLPLPLEESLDAPMRNALEEVLCEAESVVREAQDALGREDTDPSIPVAVLDEERAIEGAVPIPLVGRFTMRLPRGSRLAALCLACAVAFVHGWAVGGTPAEASPLLSCDKNHCHLPPSNEKGKEDQRP